MTDIVVFDADGTRVNVPLALEPGRAAAAASKPIAFSTEDLAAINAITAALATTHADLAALEALLPAAFAGNGGLKSGYPDIRPGSGTITAADVASTSSTGQGSVSLVTGAPTAGSATAQAINGQSTARIQVTGTWVGSVAFEGSSDGGTTWVIQQARIAGSLLSASVIAGNGQFVLNTSGLTNVRLRAIAWTSGTATVLMAFGTAPGVHVSPFQYVSDNVSGAQLTIKPASTNPAFADTALVVANLGPTSTSRIASSAATTNATNAKTSAGRVYSASGKNNAAYDVFLVLYDATTNPPVPGTATIRKKIVCPAGQAFVYDWPLGLSFASGIGYAFTKLVADADTTVLVAADITAFNLDYV